MRPYRSRNLLLVATVARKTAERGMLRPRQSDRSIEERAIARGSDPAAEPRLELDAYALRGAMTSSGTPTSTERRAPRGRALLQSRSRIFASFTRSERWS